MFSSAVPAGLNVVSSSRLWVVSAVLDGMVLAGARTAEQWVGYVHELGLERLCAMWRYCACCNL